MPLIEIVTEPDFHSAEEVTAYVEKLRRILQYADICDGKMEQGSLRCDVNISLSADDTLGTRTEIKNLNSVKAIGRAIAAEIERQTDILEAGGTVIQQTLRYDDATGMITPMREKVDAEDYRYYPDCDILPVVLTEEEIEAFRAALPELPDTKLARYVGKYNIAAKNAAILLNDKCVSGFFDSALKEYDSPKTLSNFIIGDLLSRVNRGEADMNNLPFSPGEFADLQRFVDEGKVNRDMRKEILREMLATGDSPAKICEARSLWIREDTAAVESVIDKVLAANPKAVGQYRGGEVKVFGFLMGQASRELKGSAAPATVKKLLEEKLK